MALVLQSPQARGEALRARTLTALAVLARVHRRPPTTRELQVYLGLRSLGQLDYHLRVLEGQGKIRRGRGARNIRRLARTAAQ